MPSEMLTRMFGKILSSARDRKALVVKQPLDFKDGLDIPAPVKPVPTGTFHGLQRGKLRLPISQDEGLRRRKTAHFADTE
jgi:hypothetical protein